jgi:hypothetical protein
MTIYSKKIVQKINRYRLHLQVITFYNLLTYDDSQVHPNILIRQQPKSHLSTIH